MAVNQAVHGWTDKDYAPSGGMAPMWQAKTTDDLLREVETERQNDRLWRIAGIEQSLQKVWKDLQQIDGWTSATTASDHVEDALDALKEAFTWVRETHQRQNDEQMAHMAGNISHWGNPMSTPGGNYGQFVGPPVPPGLDTP